MNISFYIPTFNRPSILQQSISSLVNNTTIKPDEVWIIDDGSDINIRKGLLQLNTENGVNLILHAKNMGIGYSFERIYNLMRQNDKLDIACIVESDYIWRKGWLEDCLAVFESSPYTIAIAGTDHPDMYNRFKTHTTFPSIMNECFGKDLESREYLYKPFDLETKLGNIKVQGVSNSCGCMIIHWKRLKEILNLLDLEQDFWKRMDRAFNKGITHDTRKNASDGHMSSTISNYGEQYLKSLQQDLSKNFPMLSICDYSISLHVCGGGENGKIVGEGETFVISPKWDDKYLDINPRSVYQENFHIHKTIN